MKYRIVLFSLLALGKCEVFDLSCSNRRVFVDGHTLKRMLVQTGKVPNQPPATKMQSMVWDAELAQKAADWASRHIYQKNPDNSIPSNRFTTGENLYYYTTTDPDYVFNINLALDFWFNEYLNYVYGPFKPEDADVTGHYTQMIWANTGYLGCAVSRQFENGLIFFYVVCYYGPGGNVIGETPYPAGYSSGSMVCETHDCSIPYGTCC